MNMNMKVMIYDSMTLDSRGIMGNNSHAGRWLLARCIYTLRDSYTAS